MKILFKLISIAIVSALLVMTVSGCCNSGNPLDTDGKADVSENQTENVEDPIDSTGSETEDSAEPAEKTYDGDTYDFTQFYKYCFCSLCSGYINSQGEAINFEGTFVDTRMSEIQERLTYYYQFFKDTDSCAYKNFMWYVVRDLGLTREDIERYRSFFEGDHPKEFTEEDVDALFIEDEYLARDAMRCRWTLFDGENVYRIIDLEKMSKEEFLSHNFTEEDVGNLIEFFEEYPDSFDYTQSDNPELARRNTEDKADRYISLIRSLAE